MNPDDLWAGLEADAKVLPTGELIARRVYAESPYDIRLAVEAPGHCRMLLVLLSPTQICESVELPSARGFTTQRVALAGDLSARVGIAVRLTDDSYRELFSSLVQDVARALVAQADSRVAFGTLVARLKAWQGFMQRATPDGLDVISQIGLYGELRFLHDQLIPCLGAGRALQSWTGPAGAPQDFQCGATAIEVKTTAADHHLLRITNALQLDDSTIDALYLAHFAVDRRNAHGRTLVELIHEIRSVISSDGSASELFSSRLLQAGYHDCHTELYRHAGFADRALQIYRVRDTFPRILMSNIPDGLADIKYSIQAAAIAPFAVPIGDAIRSIAETSL